MSFISSTNLQTAYSLLEETIPHKVKKGNHEKNWLREAAEAVEPDIDSDIGLWCVFLFPFHDPYNDSYVDPHLLAFPSKHKKKTANEKTAALKAELKEFLAQPLVARGVSTRYITSGSRSIVEDVMAGQCMFHFPSLFFSSSVVD